VNGRHLFSLGMMLFVFFATQGVHANSNINTNTIYPFEDMKKESQFKHLLRDLRCLVCQNQDLADSNAGLAMDLRNEVYHLVQSGHSDNDILSYLTNRYGDFILFQPPLKGMTLLLWFGPALFMLFGLLIFWRTCLRQSIHE